MGVLTVYLEKCSNLESDDLFTLSDPYVKLEIEQDNIGHFRDEDFGWAKSDTLQGRNPEFDQTFQFNLPSLDNMVLTCKIRDEDTCSRDDKMGWCKINLERADLCEDPKEFEEVIV